MEEVIIFVYLFMGKCWGLISQTFALLLISVCSLWGNPKHLEYLTTAIRQRYDDSELQILVVKRNSGTFTYDGIELGGERVTREIEDAIEEYARNGVEIRKISIVGYSLGR